MNQLRISTDNYGRLSSDSRQQIRSLIESRGGLIGRHLAKVALPQIEHAIQRHVEAHPRPVRIRRVGDFRPNPFGSTRFGPANGFSTLTPGMTLRPVESSSLRRVGYNPASRILQIEFKTGGVWEYLQVPPAEHEGLMKADSPGRYFYSHIRSHFQSRKIQCPAP